MITINICDFTDQFINIDRRDKPIFYGIEEDSFDHPIEVHIVLSKERNNNIEAKGKVSTQVTLTCCRCLKSHTEEIDVDFDIVYSPKKSEEEGKDYQFSEKFINMSFYSDELQIGEDIRQAVLLGMPVKPLCDPDCKGLCPVCGKDLNIGKCSCSKKWEDGKKNSAWKKLEVLKKKKN